MRVLHVIPGLNESSGPSQVMAKLSEFQVAAGHEVTVCHVTGRGADPGRSFAPGVTLRGFPAKVLRGWAYAPALGRYLSEAMSGFDVAHIHSLWLYPNLATSRAARRAAVPYLIRPAGSLEPWSLKQSGLKKRLYLRFLERPLLERAARLHAVSEKEATQLRTYGFSRAVATIPNGIDLKEYETLENRSSLRRKLAWPPARNYLLFLSRLHPGKGVEILVEALSRLEVEALDLRLMVAGPCDHDYGRGLQREVAATAVGSRVHFLGEVTGLDKVRSLQAADAFVLPSSSENFGVAILEALAAGTPAVVSDQTPWAILNESGAGWWLPREAGRFAEAIEELLTLPPEEREGMAHAARKVAAGFSWDQIVDRLTALYEDVIEESKALR